MSKSLIALPLFVGLLAAAGPVGPVNTDSRGVAVEGYDPVAYFTAGEPTKGDPRLAHEWQGARYLFASAANLEAFKKDPAKYAPQYGGYCAYAVSKGSTAGISPKAWKVVDGKLYLNHRLARGKFEKDVPGNIARADENWPKIPKKPAKD
ncbi:MAG: YHS domain-containing (seleno)protein [Bryobacteraceae bacterium]